MPTNFSHHVHCSPSPRMPVEATSVSVGRGYLGINADKSRPNTAYILPPSFHPLNRSLHPKDNPARVNQPEPSVLFVQNPKFHNVSTLPKLDATCLEGLISKLHDGLKLPPAPGQRAMLPVTFSSVPWHQNTDDNAKAISQWLSPHSGGTPSVRST